MKTFKSIVYENSEKDDIIERIEKVIEEALKKKLTVLKYQSDLYLVFDEIEDIMKKNKLIGTKTVLIDYFRDEITGLKMVEFPFKGYLVDKEYESEYYKSKK